MVFHRFPPHLARWVGVVKLPYLMISIPALALFYYGYFYFAPMLYGTGRNSSAALSLALVRSARTTPLRTIIPILAISALLGGLVGLFSPDGREPFYNVGLAVASAIADVIGLYLAASYGAWLMGRMPENSAVSELQFKGAEAESTNASGDLLTLKTSSILLIAGLALNLGNFGQSASMEPAARITLKAAKVEESKVILDLVLLDEKYKLRGVQPMAFTLAGPNRGSISSPPELLSINDAPLANPNFRFQMPRTADALSIRLNFLTTRSAEDLKEIQDLHLWYKNVKLFKLELNSIK